MREASRICAAANLRIERVDIPPFDRKRSVARAMRRIVAIQRASISGLRGLHPPTHLSDLNQRWIALLDQSADELDVTRGILLGRDSTLAAEYAVKAYTLSQRARALVASHGVTSCRAPQDLRLVSVS